ncbi:hypothetical protein IE53DRAFT_387099 [Violaceomyces palustris]|uniref:Uncharacterized protein n=1 Tax=Violaceomyces palustris TaxID=1673888 RepID=A0ACD0NXL3_9BASI|nr:hypothetical protein IE53DRAFT_387099 [Violaceomyces palustris]
MSLPKILAQVLFEGTRIVGRALVEAGRQAGRNARAGRVEASAGAGEASSSRAGTPSQQLTRSHRMTLDEAKLILNVKADFNIAEMATRAAAKEGEKTALDEFRENMIKNYDHLFAINAPPAPKGQTGGGSGSFFLQSKVVRARERLEAEMEIGKAKEEAATAAEAPKDSGSQPSA